MRTIVQGHKQNFETLQSAFRNGDVALLECEINDLPFTPGEKVAVVVATQHESNGDITFVPFCVFFNGNPYEFLNPPKPEGGFMTQEECNA